ncbi:TetR/AcrR family transcriptional regulator [Actinokineospora sp. NBRC 105648]|uniref:TetR/AcrR family transcriptional regulator n=1 Tax=Actinokineospora sp. NBRC 105648 TaxID=3032206 RepID=UPI0024A13EE3|nr:TetR/AcrR family transcriptional regulator [Actinokineospora sp. NBRC 105648]GLZ42606.1 TetR family transcriptional regulator [Actinokineospora sp. NBRC 105648]
MARRSDTRDRTLRTAAELFSRQGYHGTGLNQVLAEGGLPKGSLYFHFPGGKEQLAAEAIELSSAELCAWIADALAEAEDGASALTAIVEGLAAQLVASDYRTGCPIGTVAQDIGDTESVRAACAEAFARWHALLSDYLVRQGFSSQADTLASTLLAAIQGAQLLARNCRDTAPLLAVGKTLAPLLRGH